ncbi:MAG: hypothetical protein J5507_00920 [Clostridia bacterium]|nr:hypothetical protein [Clostridia bacterium]
MQKICGFYVSNVHLVTMILPFIKEQLQKEVKIETFFEENLNENINKILFNLIINEDNKQKILNINWKNTKIKKYNNIENKFKKLIDKNKENIILVSGNKKYINEVNNILSRFFEKNNYKNISIINFYKVSEFEDSIREILNKHEFILNTSGIHRIEEVFVDYEKAN